MFQANIKIYIHNRKILNSLFGGGQGKLRYSSPVAQINKSTLQRHTGEAYKRDSHTAKTLHTKYGCIIGTNSFLFVYFPYFPGSFPSGLVHIQMFHWLSMSMVERVRGLALAVRVSASKTKQSRAVPHSINSSLSTMHRALVRFDPPHHIRCVWCVWVWWYISVISRHERWRQGELKFKVILSYISSSRPVSLRYGDHVFHKGKIPWKFPLKSITGYQHYKEHERTGTDRITDGDLKLTLNTLIKRKF